MKADRSSVAQQASAPLEVVSLVSLGQHPVSGRLRRAEQDARALELCLALERQSAPGAVSLSAWHASGSEIALGSEQDQALRGYLGMGLESLTLVTPSFLPASKQTAAAISPPKECQTHPGKGIFYIKI